MSKCTVCGVRILSNKKAFFHSQQGHSIKFQCVTCRDRDEDEIDDSRCPTCGANADQFCPCVNLHGQSDENTGSTDFIGP